MTDASSSWRGAARFAAVALLLTLAAMWATSPSPTCEMSPEPHQRLNLSLDVDREHLATDISDAERIARRYSARRSAASARGASATTLDAFDGDAEQCRSRLAQQITNAHDVTPAQMLAARSRG